MIRATFLGPSLVAGLLVPGLQPTAKAGEAHFNAAPYLMEEGREIALAKSAAPDKISDRATVMVLREHGYETVIEGANNFICLVLRSWGNPTHDPEYIYAPGIIVPECLDARSAETILPLQLFRAELGLEGTSGVEIQEAVTDGFRSGRFKRTQTVSFSYMMSAAMTLSDGSSLMPHIMVYLPDDYTNEMLGGLGYRDATALVEGGPDDPFTAANIYLTDKAIEPRFSH